MIDDSVLHDLVTQVSPQLDERPDDTFVRAAAAVLRPHLESIVAAYQKACHASPVVAQEVRLFMQCMLDAEA